MESQLELYNEGVKFLAKIKEALPAEMAAQEAVRAAVYRDGALSLKVKRLISLASALRAGCPNCIVGQTKGAVEAGATREEVLEATAVVVASSGTTALAESYRVVKVLEELGY